MPLDPKQHQISLDGREFCYFEWGEELDSVILLLHATGFHARCWDQTVAQLKIKRRVLALDMRGHGRSEKTGPFTWTDFGHDVIAFIDALALNSITVAGHSMGGYCALFAAAHRPNSIDSLVLVDPVILSPEEYANRLDSKSMDVRQHPIARRRNNWSSPDQMFENFQNRHPFSLWKKEVLRNYCDFGLLPSQDGEFELACPPNIEAKIYQETDGRNISHLFDRIPHPVLVMRAKQRKGSRTEMDFSNSPTWPELANNLPSARDMPFPHLSHFIPMEQPELVAKILSTII